MIPNLRRYYFFQEFLKQKRINHIRVINKKQQQITVKVEEKNTQNQWL